MKEGIPNFDPEGLTGNLEEGIKEKDSKLDYSEINLRLIDLMAERMMSNKTKYPKGNTKKIIPIEDITWAAFRHIRKILQPIKGDSESLEDHIAAIACNMSMIIDQLDNKKQ
jgi:hypothetical protein